MGKQLKQRLLRTEADDSLPLTLRHERIYILPTARGLGFVAVALVMILASMNYGLNLGYALSFILVGLFASCLLATYLNLSQLSLHSISSEDTFAGSAVEYRVAVQEKRGRSRYSIELDAAGVCTELDIRANKTATADLRCTDTKRGVHELGRVTISSDFPLGLWRGWGYVHARADTYIYPRPETPSTPPAVNASASTEKRLLNIEEREFDQLKRYESTDSLSSVAWKTVAQGRGWFSKAFNSTHDTDELVLSWTSTEALQNHEQRLSRLCAWVLQAEKMAIPYQLDFPNYSSPTSVGRIQQKVCLRYLANYESAR